jgi:hypothetical protein
MATKSKRTFLSFLVVALFVASLGISHPAVAAGRNRIIPNGRPIKVVMTGAQEAPGPGDPDGRGIARFTFNQGRGTICYKLRVWDIAPAAAAHIHRAPAGSPGPVVVPLAAPTNGVSKGCASVDKELIKEIRKNPAEFYVNVHNADFTGGAVRAQLGK